MIFQKDPMLEMAIFVLGLCGLWVAWHIHKHKKEGKVLVCPMNFNCDVVVHSNYSKFLGIPLEFFGMLYYALVAFSYLLLFFYPIILPIPFMAFVVMLSFSAFLFSIYLVCVQIFILKEGCFWCFVSAFLSISIFVSTFFLYNFSNIMSNLFN